MVQALRTMKLFALFGCLFVACDRAPADPGPSTEPVRVALTFDDLPYQTRGPAPVVTDPALWARVNAAVLAALAKHRAPAAVFVNCGFLSQKDELVDAWWAAGHAVGNHTAHH